MKIIILNKNPLSAYPAHIAVGRSTDSLLVTTAEIARASDSEDLRAFSALKLVSDYHSWEVDQIVRDYSSAGYCIGRIVSMAECDVIRTARLREQLGIPGQSLESAYAYRDKLIMNTRSRAHGIPVPDFQKIDNPTDLMEFVEESGFPVILKPRFGAGSERIHFILDRPSLDRCLRAVQTPPDREVSGEWLAERYIDGNMYYVDGVTQQGKVIYSWPGRYSMGSAEAVSLSIPKFGYLLEPADQMFGPLQAFSRKVHAAMPTVPFPTAFHLEVIVTEVGQLLMCEVCSRPGGGAVGTAFCAAFGIDIYSQHLRGQAGLPLELDHQPDRPMKQVAWVWLTTKEGVFNQPRIGFPSEQVRLRYLLASGTRCQRARTVLDAAAIGIIEGNSSQEARETAEEVLAWWDRCCVWT
jgi:hypothetical protein